MARGRADVAGRADVRPGRGRDRAVPRHGRRREEGVDFEKHCVIRVSSAYVLRAHVQTGGPDHMHGLWQSPSLEQGM